MNWSFLTVLLLGSALPWAKSFCLFGNNGGFHPPPPPPPPPRTPSFQRLSNGYHGGDPEPKQCDIAAMPRLEEFSIDEQVKKQENDALSLLCRGGSAKTRPPFGENVVATSASFWSKTFGKIGSTITAPIRTGAKAISNIFKGKEKLLEEKLLEQLSTMPVAQLSLVPNNTVLPTQVVQVAARRTGILGQPLKPDSVQEFARALKRWYTRNGYVLHSMTGATLKPETATAEIQLQEPRVSQKPVNIVFCKELIVDEETGELLTKRQYKEKHQNRKGIGFLNKVSFQNANTTLVETLGRTRPSKIASALKLEPGKHFRWDASRWRSISNSGIFSRILKATPQPLQDGSVQLLIVAQEASPRRIEYGLGTSRYTGSWEGELDFEHANLFGGGESLGISLSRGAKDAEPSIRVRFSNDNFGLDGGYEVEAFSDYLGGGKPSTSKNSAAAKSKKKEDMKNAPFATEKLKVSAEAVTQPPPAEPVPIGMEEPDASPEAVVEPKPVPGPQPTELAMTNDEEKVILADRRGVTFRLRNPFDGNVLSQSALPLDARSDLDCKITTGTSIQTKSKFDKNDDLLDRFVLGPFAAASATTRQTFPLLPTRTAGKRPVVLALKHSLTSSTPTIPLYEARAQGIGNMIRDSTENGPIIAALKGTTELRIPVDIPRIQTLQDGRIVLFGDWLFATQDYRSPIFRKSCVGVGLRKSIQGIPVRYDICYTWEGKVKSSISLGHDFEA